MTEPIGSVDFEWTSTGQTPDPARTDVPTGLEHPNSGGRWRLRVPALVVVVLAIAVAAVVSSTLRSDDDAAAFGLVEPGRLPLTVEPVWTQVVEVGVVAESIRVTEGAVVFIVADRGGSFRKVEALDPATGGSLWERRSGTDVLTSVVTVTDTSYVVATSVEDDRRLVGYDLATGATVWEEPLDSFGSIVALASMPLLVESLQGSEPSTRLRDADSGDVLAEFEASYAGVDLAGMMRLFGADATVSTFDVAAFDAVRRERGLAVAVSSIEPRVRGELSSSRGLAIVGEDLVAVADGAIEVSGNVVVMRDADGEEVEPDDIVGILPVGQDRLVIETFDGQGGSFLHGGSIRRGLIELDWMFEGFIQPGLLGKPDSFVSDGGPRAVVITPGDRVTGGTTQLFDLVAGQALAEFDAALRPGVLMSSNGVLTIITSSADGFMTTLIAYDQDGDELWRIGPTENGLGAAIGNEFIVMLARNADGEVSMTGHGP